MDLFTELHEFVSAKLIGFQRLPGKLAQARALFSGSDAVEPVVAAQKVSTRITDGGVGLVAQGVEDIFAKSTLVRLRRLGIVNPFVNAAAHMFDKSTKEQG